MYFAIVAVLWIHILSTGTFFNAGQIVHRSGSDEILNVAVTTVLYSLRLVGWTKDIFLHLDSREFATGIREVNFFMKV